MRIKTIIYSDVTAKALPVLLAWTFAHHYKKAVRETDHGPVAQKHARLRTSRKRNPGTARVSTKNSKAKVILGRVDILRPTTTFLG